MAVIDSARGQILDYLEIVSKEIKEIATQKKMVASGRTLASLLVVPTATGGKLVAADHIIYLEDGRGPTSDGATTGNPNLTEIIAQWARDKGIAVDPYATAKTIHKEGTRLFRQGGHSGVLSIPLNGAGISDLYAEIATMYRQTISSEIYAPLFELQNV